MGTKRPPKEPVKNYLRKFSMGGKRYQLVYTKLDYPESFRLSKDELLERFRNSRGGKFS